MGLRENEKERTRDSKYSINCMLQECCKGKQRNGPLAAEGRMAKFYKMDFETIEIPE